MKNKKVATGIVMVMLAAVMLAGFLYGGKQVFSATLDEIQDQIDSAGDRKGDIADQLKEVNQEIIAREKDLAASTEKYTALLREKQENATELEKQLYDLEELFGQIEELNETIEEAQAEYDAALALFYKRASVAMRYSNYSTLKLFTESKSFFTYVDLTRMVSDMLVWDEAEMTRLTLMREDLERKKELAEVASVDLQALIEEKERVIDKLLNDQEILESDLEVSQRAIDALEAQEAKLEEESEKVAKEIVALQKKYDAVLAEQRAREEEERRKREEAERAAREAEERKKAEEAAQQDDGTSMLFPCPSGLRISSPYGWRIHPISKVWKFHQGIDIAAYGGSDIISVLSGTVITARWHDSYGYYVVVYHGDGLSTLYAHASKLLVKEGDYVSRGQVIALVGSTGSSTGNHLHFEVRINGETRDPLDYLPNKFG